MTHFEMPVSVFMSSPVVSVAESASLAQAEAILRERVISCVAVKDLGGRISGVLSRTDLLRVGRIAARGRSHAPLLSLPPERVADIMRSEVIAVPRIASVSSAAGLMVSRRINRVFVIDGEALVGVFSTKDLLLAIDRDGATNAIGSIMSTPVITVPTSAPIAHATDRLAHAQVAGLCVVDENDWPVGTFTQTEALACRELDGDTPVEDVMSYALVCMHVRTVLCRAAAAARATRARRVLAVEDGRVRGIVSGLDFARFAASSNR